MKKLSEYKNREALDKMADIIEQTLQRMPHQESLTLENYLECDAEARIIAKELI